MNGTMRKGIEMATSNTDERSKIISWFENHFKEAAKETTKTLRLEDGRIDYSFSALNNSGYDFSNFSFKIKILNKANKEEIGTARIKVGKWSQGKNKKFRTKISIPKNVKSLSFVMFSNSVEYNFLESSANDDDGPTLAEAIEGLGKSISEAGANGNVFGELFSNGGMPQGTTTTKTSTVTIGDKTTKTQTVTYNKPKSEGGTKSSTKRTTSSSAGSTGIPIGSFARKKQEKKMNKLRLGKSGGFVACMIFGALMLIAALSPDNTKLELIQYLAIGGGLLVLGGILKFLSANKAKRIRAYEVNVDKNGNTSFYELSVAVGRPVTKVADDLHKMVVEGFFPGAIVDAERSLIIMTRDGKPIESVERSAAESRKARRTAARDKGLLPESLEDLITMTDDADIKKKLKGLKLLSDRIDARVLERADLEEQVKDFREKFFPEVVKLTDDYNGKIANLAAVAKTENVETSEIEIDANPDYLTEQSVKIKEQLIKLMDSVLEASENLLERLHEDDIMDITADIQMLQTTLASKGLLDSDFDIK